jgi:hypothetical protein
MANTASLRLGDRNWADANRCPDDSFCGKFSKIRDDHETA